MICADGLRRTVRYLRVLVKDGRDLKKYIISMIS